MEPASPEVEGLQVSAFAFPTETPEADGTLNWNETTLALVHAADGGAANGPEPQR